MAKQKLTSETKSETKSKQISVDLDQIFNPNTKLVQTFAENNSTELLTGTTRANFKMKKEFSYVREQVRSL